MSNKCLKRLTVKNVCYSLLGVRTAHCSSGEMYGQPLWVEPGPPGLGVGGPPQHDTGQTPRSHPSPIRPAPLSRPLWLHWCYFQVLLCPGPSLPSVGSCYLLCPQRLVPFVLLLGGVCPWGQGTQLWEDGTVASSSILCHLDLLLFSQHFQIQ